MALWLFKQEPECYRYDDLERDGETVWDGVSNPLARKHLRQVKAGDRIWLYHTGKEKAIVGEMKAKTNARPDPNADDPNALVIDVQPVRRLRFPVTLARIKQDEELADWDLVRLPRLSVMRVTRGQWRRVQALGSDA